MNRRDRLDLMSVSISAASLGVGILALCLNEKKEGDHLAEKIDSRKYSSRRDLKKAYAKEIKRMAVSDVGYTGTVIVLNEKGEQQAFGLVPLGGPDEGASNRASPRKDNRSWVAMEINGRTGKDRQAIVCASQSDAKARATAMKKAHRKGSQQSKDCIQGYARMDTSEGIDVAGWFSGACGKVTRV